MDLVSRFNNFTAFFRVLSIDVRVRNHSYQDMFRLQVPLHENQTDFDTKGFLRTRFETEAQGNSEMAYSLHQ